MCDNTVIIHACNIIICAALLVWFFSTCLHNYIPAMYDLWLVLVTYIVMFFMHSIHSSCWITNPVQILHNGVFTSVIFIFVVYKHLYILNFIGLLYIVTFSNDHIVTATCTHPFPTYIISTSQRRQKRVRKKW